MPRRTSPTPTPAPARATRAACPVPDPPAPLVRRFRRRLLAWYAAEGRDLPWRRTRDPYAILVSEIMLQQTPVSRVLPKYDEWLARFPTPAALARARPARVVRAWRPLGYNARARRLHGIARAVVRDGGELPRTLDGLLALDGVGEYTARAVLLFAHGERVPVLDTNVARVLDRVFGEADDVSEGGPPRGARARTLWRLAARLVPRKSAYDYTQALMDLGATVCLKRHARCERCPLRVCCGGYQGGIPAARRARERLAATRPPAGSGPSARGPLPRPAAPRSPR